jgi:hypothetical protein
MHRDDALAFACGTLCLQVHSVLPLAMKPVTVQHDAIHANKDLVTWLARGARFLTIIKTVVGTRVYDHADDMLYYANPNTELPKDCPEGHAFLCQTVCDRLPDGSSTPRLLVMDLVCPRIDCPRQRGDTLRRLTHVFPSACHVQWAGDMQALQAFVSSGVVPHEIEALVALRSPLQIIREPSKGIAALESLKTGRLA